MKEMGRSIDLRGSLRYSRESRMATQAVILNVVPQSWSNCDYSPLASTQGKSQGCNDGIDKPGAAEAGSLAMNRPSRGEEG